MRKRGLIVQVAALVALLAVAGCSVRRKYPDTNIGWHSGDYTVVFGRLQQVSLPTTNPDQAALPAWTIRFGSSDDVYRGELALTPPERFAGYTGGERVEIHGHLLTEATSDRFSGRWYVVDTIRMWNAYR